MSADGGEPQVAGALLAVPGDLGTPTGGYGYARRLIAECGGAGAAFRLRHWPLPGGFPNAAAGTIAETARRLAMAPAGWPVIVDGLALGVLPPEVLAATGGPVIGLCHHPLALEDPDSPGAAALEASERAALAACAHVIATSRTTAELLAARFGVPPARITVAPPGTDPAPARPPHEAGGTVEILSVGGLIPRKGHDVLLDALARLSDRAWRLTIVGPARDPDCAEALRAQAEAAGIADRVRFAGALDAEGLAAAYAAADLFALAPRHEGYGMAFAEAMAHGLPVVGTDAGAVAEATLGAARLVAPGDGAALAAALGSLLDDAAERASLARACAEAGRRLPRWTDTLAAVRAAVAAATAPDRVQMGAA